MYVCIKVSGLFGSLAADAAQSKDLFYVMVV
jgi:hypothetical protein